LALAVGYLAACGIAHHAALGRVEQFARSQPRPVGRLAAIPMPPGLLAWDGLLSTPSGVYEGRFALNSADQHAFRFAAESQPNRFTARALELGPVKTYLGFARFPVVHFSEGNGRYIVDLNDVRFYRVRSRRARSFTYRVVFDAKGDPIEQGWLRQ